MRNFIRGGIASGLAGVLLAVAPSALAQPVRPATAAGHEALTARNRAIITQFSDIFYRQRDIKRAYMTYVVPDYIQHNPDIPDGRDAAIASVGPIFSIPGGHFDVKRIVVDGDIAVVHVLGAADPKRSPLAIFDMYRLKDGKIVEHWDVGREVPKTAKNAHPMF